MAIPANVNFADKFSSKLDQAFEKNSYTDRWVNQEYDFDGVSKIKVYTLDATPLVDYDMSSTTNRYGGFSEVNDTVDEYELTKDKAFQKALDKMNVDDSAMAKSAAKFLKNQMNKVFIPELDRDRFATAVEAANDPNGGGIDTYTPASVLESIRAMNAACDEMTAPLDGRVAFVTPTVLNDLKSELTPILNNPGDAIVRSRGLAGHIDGINIVSCPSNLFPADPSGTGDIKVIFWHKDALLSARKLTETKILDGAHVVSGSIIQGRFRFDSFALQGYNNITSEYEKMKTFMALAG